MNKRIKLLIQKLKELFLYETIECLARDTKFLQRKSKLNAKAFASLCIFDDDLCTSSLSTLCCRIDKNSNIKISEEGLNRRFNKNSVNFMKELFTRMLKTQNKILRANESIFKTHFNRIKITDSTSFDIPKEFKDDYKGSGGSASDSAVKIQLEYDLLTGEFLNCEVLDGISSDISYLPQLENGIKKNDLCLKDLGYFKIDHIKEIEKNDAFYISKIKNNMNIFIRNDINEKKKDYEYCQVDITKLVEPLAEGEILELSQVYIGNKKLKSRLILTKLSEKIKIKRQNNHKKIVLKGRGNFSEKSSRWYYTNAYITNVPAETLSATQVHDIYSLRWQVELMFKIWKSIFNINLVKKIKIERFQCCLYGKLIKILLSSLLVFTAKDYVYKNVKKEISEMKSFGIVKEYSANLKDKIFKGELAIAKLVYKIINSILCYGIKSKKKGKNTSIFIMEGIKIDEGELAKLAI